MGTEDTPQTNTSPSTQLMQLLWPGGVAVQAIHVAAKLGLVDLLAAGPKTVVELAEATRVNATSLARLLRALTSLGIFAEEISGRYRQTPLSEALRADHPESIRSLAMMLGARFIWEPVGWLDESIRLGQAAFERVHSVPFFRHLAENPEDAAVFNAAMSSMPSYLVDIVAAYDFSKFRRIVDVGGGHGALLAAILEANPQTRGVLQDLPPVVAGASALRREGIADRCEIVARDFFEGVPDDGDAYLLKGIIHDWNDEAAVKILRNCRRAIRPDGTLILVDTVLTGSDDPRRALMDLLMMVLTGGRERTELEFRSLLQEAGFSLTRVISTRGHSILESRPV
jgi:O-methyltransferase domain/Dimerisation domain